MQKPRRFITNTLWSKLFVFSYAPLTLFHCHSSFFTSHLPQKLNISNQQSPPAWTSKMIQNMNKNDQHVNHAWKSTPCHTQIQGRDFPKGRGKWFQQKQCARALMHQMTSKICCYKLEQSLQSNLSVLPDIVQIWDFPNHNQVSGPKSASHK